MLHVTADIQHDTDHVDPLQQGAAPLGRGLVALAGVAVPLRGLHVREDVRSRLVQGRNLDNDYGKNMDLVDTILLIAHL